MTSEVKEITKKDSFKYICNSAKQELRKGLGNSFARDKS